MTVDFSEARNLKRFPFLDAARGLASIIVVASHCHLNWYWGVMDFFFVMSGFLITRSLISNCHKGRGTLPFLLYRALRLLPAYLAVMLAYEIVVLFMGTRGHFETLPYLFFYQNMDMLIGSEPIFPRIEELIPCWSLVLEERYYVLWGAFFCIVAFAKLRINLWTLIAATAMLAGGMYLRRSGLHWWTLPARFDGFLIGSLASIIIFMPGKVNLQKRETKWLLGAGWVVAAAALARLIWSGSIYSQDFDRYLDGIWLDVTCFSIVSLVLILGMLKLDMKNLHFGKIQDGLAFLGLISYETYLIHLPVILLIRRVFDLGEKDHQLRLFAAAMVISSVIAYVMHRTLTAPALKRREHIYASLENRFGSGWTRLRDSGSRSPSSND